MRGNTITIAMAEKRGKMAKTVPLYQYDYGQRLIITNLELPPVYEVHFSNELYGEAITVLGDNTGINIPDQFLETGLSIYLWLYLHEGEADGETEYSGVIPVIKRAEITDEEPTPHQATLVEQALVALNTETGKAEASRVAAEVAQAAAETAQGLAETAQTAAETAQGLAEDAQTGAEMAQGLAEAAVTDAEAAQAAAEDAQAAAEAAQAAAEAAQEAAETAQGKAEDAQAAAEAAMGDKLDKPETAGTLGQVLTSDGNGGQTWEDPTTGTLDYTNLTNKPQIGGVTLSGNKSLSDLGIAAESDIPDVTGFYTKPANGIPASDIASGVIPDVSGFYTKPETGIPATDIASGVIPDVSGKMDEPASEGTSGQVLTTDGNGGRSWTTVQGGGGTTDYTDLTNKPQIGGVTLSGNKSLSDLGAASSSDVAAKYTKPAGGIPATDIASGVIPDISGKADKTDTVLNTTLSRGRIDEEYFNVGAGSIAFGNTVGAAGDYSVAFGEQVTAEGNHANAEGCYTLASGDASHSEGNSTYANADYSHVEGWGSSAYGVASHAEGYKTVALGDSAHVSGRCNVIDDYSDLETWDSSKSYVVGDKVKIIVDATSSYPYHGFAATVNNVGISPLAINGRDYWESTPAKFAEIVGNGTTVSESNARALDWDGNEYLMGDLYVGCDEDSTNGTKVMREPATEGTSGQVLTTDGQGGRTWATVQGGGGTTDYTDLTNKPQIAGVTLSGNKSLSDLGIAAASAIPDVSGFYTKPSGGIPANDLSGDVQDSLDNADAAYQLPVSGIPSTDMSNAVQTSLGKADTAYQKPSGGIPASDLASAVQTSLGKADSAYQKPSGGIPASDIASGVIPDISGKIDKPSSPATGAFLVYNGTAWVAQTLSTWQGGNY